jgi:hypothetical protein
MTAELCPVDAARLDCKTGDTHESYSADTGATCGVPSAFPAKD